MKYVLLFLLPAFCACSPNNVTVDNSLKKYFDENQVTGSFGLFDNSLGQFTIYNLSQFKDSAYLPASTFKIVNSLIGLETGRVKDDSTILPWNGTTWNGVPACNADLPMYQAFRLSCVPWYQQLARMIGKDTMQHWIDTMGYAQRYSKPQINIVDSFWLNNSIKVTPDEQLGLVKKLYFHQLPFQPRTCRIVQSMMLMEKKEKYMLSYKTGLGKRENGNWIGWVVGWVEKTRHPYFFVLQLESPNAEELPNIRMKILKSILKKYELI